jgi:hypothetical protein
MTVSIPQVSNTNTFYFWKNQTNFLANVISTVAVTTDSNTAVGNAAITGTFTSNAVNTFNLSVNGVVNLKGIYANNTLGTSGQVLTSNGSSSYWSSLVGTITQLNTSGGLTGGPITSTGTVSLDVYSGSDANNTNYPVGSIVSVYTGTNLSGQRAVSSVEVIYSDNLQGIEGISGSPLTGTWRNRGLCGTDYRSPSEIRYYYLYQRVA